LRRYCLLDLQARSLLNSGLCERLIDPHLSGDYKREEMEIMISVARLCLVHSSSRRPTMKMVRFLISLHIKILHKTSMKMSSHVLSIIGG
jgi:interleukin-1 receptor-associated kinase 1